MISNLSTNSFQKAYRSSCINLIKTLTIKSSAAASLINQGLLDSNPDYVISENKRTWKYYLNITGEYHESDEPMMVTSLDTRESIVFNKENLLIHVATAEAYRYGSRYYYSLVNEYPDNEQLILGILYPAKMDEAIEARDGSILAYDPRYIEPQEATLLHELESYSIKHVSRWTVPSYKTCDNLYAAADHAILVLNLIPILDNLRYKRCKTDEVHSFHIRQYLASHFRLDEHYDFLTIGQRLYLYRNLMRLTKNFGRNEQFTELVQNILTKRSIPLADYSIRQLNKMDDSYRPTIRARKKKINGSFNSTEVEYFDIDVLYDKERFINSGNDRDLNIFSDKMTLDMRNGPSGALQTKVLESSMVDYSNTAPDKLNEVLIRELIYSVYKNRYLAYCDFRDPKTGEQYNLSCKDALIYLIYLAYKITGDSVETIPEVMCSRYLLDPLPSKKELEYVADVSYSLRSDLADYLLTNMPKHTPIRSVASFYKRCYQIYEQCIVHWQITSNTEDLWDRAEAQKMCSRMFGYTLVKFFDEPMDTTTWLNKVNLPLYDRTVDEGLELITSVFTSVTGLVIDNSNSIPHIQKSLISLMKKLSSYSVQYISEINEDPIMMLNRIATRTSKPRAMGYDEFKVNPLIDVMDDPGKVVDSVETNLTELNVEVNAKLQESSIEIDPIVDTDISCIIKEYIEENLNSPKTRIISTNGTPYEDDVPFAGYEFYLTLTQEQIKSIPN